MSKGTITYTAYRAGASLHERPYEFRKTAKQLRQMGSHHYESGKVGYTILKENDYIIGKMTMKDGTKHTYIYIPHSTSTIVRSVGGVASYKRLVATEESAMLAFKEILNDPENYHSVGSFYFVLNPDTRDKVMCVSRPGYAEFWEEATSYHDDGRHFAKRSAFYPYDSPIKEWVEDEEVNQYGDVYRIRRRNREVKQVIYNDYYARWGDYVFPVNVKRAERFWSHNLDEVMKGKEAVPITDLREKDNELNEAIIAEAMKPERVAKALEAYGEAYFENC